MPTECSAEQFDFGIVEGRAVEAAFDAGLVTSDADAVLATVGDAIRLCAELSPEQREEYHWKLAIHSLNIAIKELRYINTATINLQTALNLGGMLAQPPKST
jgi:hypothetical protein